MVRSVETIASIFIVFSVFLPAVVMAQPSGESDQATLPSMVVPADDDLIVPDGVLDVSDLAVEGRISTLPGQNLVIHALGTVTVSGAIEGADPKAPDTLRAPLQEGVREGRDGIDAPSVYIFATRLIVEGGAIVAQDGTPGEAVVIDGKSPDLLDATVPHVLRAVGGDGGAGGDVVIEAQYVEINGSVRAGRGGDGGWAVTDLRGSPVYAESASAHGGNGGASGGLHLITDELEIPASVHANELVAAHGGDAQAWGSPGSSSASSPVDGIIGLVSCAPSYGQGSAPEVERGEDGVNDGPGGASPHGESVSPTGEGGANGCDGSSPGDDGIPGRAGGAAEAFGGDGADGGCSGVNMHHNGGDGGTATARGGSGGNGGNGADGAPGEDGASDPTGLFQGPGEDGGNGGNGGKGALGGDATAEGGDGGDGATTLANPLAGCPRLGADGGDGGGALATPGSGGDGGNAGAGGDGGDGCTAGDGGSAGVRGARGHAGSADATGGSGGEGTGIAGADGFSQTGSEGYAPAGSHGSTASNGDSGTETGLPCLPASDDIVDLVCDVADDCDIPCLDFECNPCPGGTQECVDQVCAALGGCDLPCDDGKECSPCPGGAQDCVDAVCDALGGCELPCSEGECEPCDGGASSCIDQLCEKQGCELPCSEGECEPCDGGASSCIDQLCEKQGCELPCSEGECEPPCRVNPQCGANDASQATPWLPPTEFTAVASEAGVELTWNASMALADNFTVYRANNVLDALSQGADAFEAIGSVTASFFVDDTATHGSTPVYYVTALRDGHESLPSNQDTPWTLVLPWS